MPNRKKKCIHCKEYSPTKKGQQTPAGFFCSMDHALEYAKEKQKIKRERHYKYEEKERRRKLREKKQALRSKAWYMREAQKWFNKFIRARDALETCISCGRHHKGQYHAGHYKSVGAAPELRFEELNCHKQCAPCNRHLSGNIVNYRIHLIKKIGMINVQWLEENHPPLKLDIKDIKAIIEKYKNKCKELENKALISNKFNLQRGV